MRANAILLALGLTAIASVADASAITLYNTGVDAFETPLPDGTVSDPHYTLVSVPGGTMDIRVRTSSGGFPIPPYLGDDGLSAWIGPNDTSYLLGPDGVDDYQTTFNLTGLNPATAVIAGQWSTDNEAEDIYINGVATGNYNNNEFELWTSFTLNSGFRAGENTLDFLVRNDGSGPTALRVEMTGTASPAPEPAGWALIITGVAGMGGRLRANRTRKFSRV